MSIEQEGVRPANERPTIMENIPESKIKEVLEEFEMFQLQKGNKGGLDFGRLTEAQIDKVIDLMGTNESNAFAYHTTRLNRKSDITEKRIDASVAGHITTRIIFVGLLIALGIITIMILIYKDAYFTQWLTFVVSGLGGFGIGRASNQAKKTSSEKDDIDE